jgi:hypothetical protein
MIKKILIGLIVLIAAFAGVVAMQPSEFTVERTAAIAAPPAAVFEQVNDLRKWDSWSPWAKLDPNAKVSFDGPQSGKGAGFAWSGNDYVGEGRMTVVESRSAELVETDVKFLKPFEGTSSSKFAFKPDGDKTAVTWTMNGNNDSFIAKAMCLVMNGRKMMGGEMEKGLANLKSVAEAR